MEEDGRAEAANVVGVVGGRQPVVVAGHIFNHVLATASVWLFLGVDNLVVVVAVAAGVDGGRYINVGNHGAGIGFDAEGFTDAEVAFGRFFVAFSLLS